MKTVRWLAPVVAWTVLILALTGSAEGTLITWAMEGTIQAVDDPLDMIGFAQEGERVKYTFTFDSDTPDTNPTPTLATYYGNAAIFNVGTEWLSADAPQIDIQRYPTVHINDGFDVLSGLQVDGMSGSVYFRLLDPSGITPSII